MTINITNSTAVVKSVNKVLSNNIPANRSDMASSITSVDVFIKTQSSTIPDTYSPESTVGQFQFPPANASLAVKNAWNNAMEKLTPSQRVMVSGQFLGYPGTGGYPQPDGIPSPAEAAGISGMSSYQDIFKRLIANAQVQLNCGGLSSDLKNGLEEMIECNTIVLNTFTEDNIK